MPNRHREEEDIHRGKASESEEGDATPGLLLKHQNTTLATYMKVDKTL
jgi:hypothetical protein